VTLLCVAAGALSQAAAADFSLDSASVKPRKAFFGEEAGVVIRFRLAAPGPADLEVRIAGGGEGEVRSYQLKQLEPGQQHELSWDGLTDSRKAAPDGDYRVSIGPADGQLAQVGRVTLRGHRYPIKGAHRLRGAIGSFGAARSGGRIHRGLDVLARCGTPLVAARSGTVVRRRSNPRLDGNFVVVSMEGERMSFRYSHLTRPAKPKLGEHVFTGQVLGYVGRTGNAASTPCHLHVELRKRGRGFVDPQPILRRWDRWS
jgi:murein DD-endopeptidase MepM/ murein hydrolase activator NlpD